MSKHKEQHKKIYHNGLLIYLLNKVSNSLLCLFNEKGFYCSWWYNFKNNPCPSKTFEDSFANVYFYQ